jgi:NADH-quinone oxidoreductase subunit A
VEYIGIPMVLLASAGVAGLLLAIPLLIAPKRPSTVKLEPFECGKSPFAISEGRFGIKFSTIAIFFIIFDIELLFVWPWAALFRQLGWFGFAEMLVFLGILMLGFLYIWKKGGLAWE